MYSNMQQIKIDFQERDTPQLINENENCFTWKVERDHI